MVPCGACFSVRRRFRAVEEPLDCHHLTRPEAARLHADRPRLDGEESCAAASLSDGRGDEAPLLIPVERHAEVALGVDVGVARKRCIDHFPAGEREAEVLLEHGEEHALDDHDGSERIAGKSHERRAAQVGKHEGRGALHVARALDDRAARSCNRPAGEVVGAAARAADAHDEVDPDTSFERAGDLVRVVGEADDAALFDPCGVEKRLLLHRLARAAAGDGILRAHGDLAPRREDQDSRRARYLHLLDARFAQKRRLANAEPRSLPKDHLASPSVSAASENVSL